jgi:hypothetical protein
VLPCPAAAVAFCSAARTCSASRWRRRGHRRSREDRRCGVEGLDPRFCLLSPSVVPRSSDLAGPR